MEIRQDKQENNDANLHGKIVREFIELIVYQFGRMLIFFHCSQTQISKSNNNNNKKQKKKEKVSIFQFYVNVNGTKYN